MIIENFVIFIPAYRNTSALADILQKHFDKLKIEFIYTKKFSEKIPENLIGNELQKVIGKNSFLLWFLSEQLDQKLNDKFNETDVEDGALYQEIMINQNSKFSEKLNSFFFEYIATELKFDYNSQKKYNLFFKLNPIEPPKTNNRINWWDANVICLEFENYNWKIRDERNFKIQELYGKIIQSGEIKIKNVG